CLRAVQEFLSIEHPTPFDFRTYTKINRQLKVSWLTKLKGHIKMYLHYVQRRAYWDRISWEVTGAKRGRYDRSRLRWVHLVSTTHRKIVRRPQEPNHTQDVHHDLVMWATLARRSKNSALSTSHSPKKRELAFFGRNANVEYPELT